MSCRALPLYQRAVELDPNFAMAYARLGTVYSNLGQSELAEKNREKAFELRDRASEHEKLYIMSHYYVDSGQLEKGITALELYKQTYPRDSTPYNNLAVVYIMMGQYENALDNARRSVQLDPDSASGYSNVAFAYAGLNRLDEAKATLNQALQRKAGAAVVHSSLAVIAWLEGDPAGVERELDLMKNDPQSDFTETGMRSAMAAYAGQLNAARTFGQKQRDAAQRLGFKEAVAGEYSQEASIEAIFADKARAIEDVAQALKLSQSPNVVLNCATALALAGENARAAKLADDVAQKRPYDTLVQFVEVPLVKAQIELNQGNPAKAIDLLDGALVYARANSGVLYVRGNAYLKAGRGADAVQAFQRLQDLKKHYHYRSRHASGQTRPGPRLRHGRRQGPRSRRLSGFPGTVEGRRSERPPAARGQGRVRQAAVGKPVDRPSFALAGRVRHQIPTPLAEPVFSRFHLTCSSLQMWRTGPLKSHPSEAWTPHPPGKTPPDYPGDPSSCIRRNASSSYCWPRL